MSDLTGNPATDETMQDADVAAVGRLRDAYRTIRGELSKVIVGQEAVLEQALIALFAGGHCILEGVPGLAKTLMISTLSRSLNLKFNRIQFTPDLMPSDITGTEVIQENRATGERAFRFLPGPLFANVILADEINRTPPKTQAALLEAMQEQQVTVGGDRHAIAPPFFVMATQNPIEQEGTYPLPEAQQDRFMFKLFVKYPSYDEEYAIAERTTALAAADITPVLGADDILGLQATVRRVPAAPHVIRHALDLARRTRPEDDDALPIVRQMINWGAGPRAVQFMVLGAKARAVLHGNYHASVEDVRAVAHSVLRHRIITNFSAEAEGFTTDRVIDDVLAATPPNDSALTRDGRVNKVLTS